MEGTEALRPEREPSKIEYQLQALSQHLSYHAENADRLSRLGIKLNGQKVEKTPDGDKSMTEPDGIVAVLQVLNNKFEQLNSKVSHEINELNETI